MRILITGATGLIGKEVGKRLAFAGHEIIAVSRNPDRARLDLPFPATVFQWRGHMEPFPRAALDGVEGIVHLAGEPIDAGRWSDDKRARIQDSRVIGTRRLVQALLHHPTAAQTLKVFVHGSAIGYYGDRGDEVVDESAEPGSDFLARLVVSWEKEADALLEGGTFANQPFRKTRMCKVRTGIVLSRRGGALLKMLPIFSKGLGGRLGRGQQWMSWIHIRDIINLFVFCLESENATGVVNGVAPEPARNERFTVELARALGRPVFLPVPETALKLVMGEMAHVVLGGTRVSAARPQDLGFRFEFPELIPALKEICEPLRSGKHELTAEQWVPRPPDAVFPYFCDEKNLEGLTPPFLGFHVIGKSTPEIREGTLIDYKLKIRGFPAKWRTKIEEWKPNERFVDVQLSGPYQQWVHTHDFVPLAGGTLVKDRVVFQLPMGLFGDTVAGWKVTSDVAEIFEFRKKKIHALFS